MKKSGIKPEDWILITLINTSDRIGINLSDWYLYRRPDGIDIESNHFYQIIEKMEKEGTIKKVSSVIDADYCLTEKGKKEAIALKKHLNFNDYYFIISKFPELELKERVQKLETFIIYLLFLSIPITLSKSIFPYITNPILFSAVSLISVSFFSLVLYRLIFNVSNIAFYWAIGLQKETLWIYKEWLWNNKNKITYPLPAVVIIMILYVIYTMNVVSWQLMVWGVILFIITQTAINYNRIVSYIQTKIWGKK